MNVVSIDFDIIMAPSIEFYNNLVNSPKLFDNPLLQVCNADLIHYKRLTLWLIDQIEYLSPDKIIFIESHEEIINFLPDSSEIHLINIDHHHDLSYENKDPNLGVNCGNWGKYLLNNNKIKDFFWIHNINSILPIFESNYTHSTIEDYDLRQLKADMIIICLSPQWVPPQYSVLFHLWVEIVNKKFHIN